MSSKKVGPDLEAQMKWDVSPFKAKNVPTFIPTPNNKWSVEDGLSRNEALFRSRLYSSPYATKDESGRPYQSGDSCIPSFSIDENSEESSKSSVSVRNASHNAKETTNELGHPDSGIASQQTHFYENISSMSFHQDSGFSSSQGTNHDAINQNDQDILGKGEIAASILYMTSLKANKENIPNMEMGQSSIREAFPTTNASKYSFDPTAPPFKPRNTMMRRFFTDAMTPVCDIGYSKSDLKAIDVANYVTGNYQNIGQTNIQTEPATIHGHDKKMSLAETNPSRARMEVLTDNTNLLPQISTYEPISIHKLLSSGTDSQSKHLPRSIIGDTGENLEVIDNPITTSIKNSPIAKQSMRTGSKFGTVTQNWQPFDPAPGSPVSSQLKLNTKAEYRPILPENSEHTRRYHAHDFQDRVGKPTIITNNLAQGGVANSQKSDLGGLPNRVSSYDLMDFGYQSDLDQEAKFLALTQRCLMKTELDRRQDLLRQSELAQSLHLADTGLSREMETPKKLTFADIVQAGIEAINKHKAENPLIYDAAKSVDYPIHTSVPPVIEQSSNSENLLSNAEITDRGSSPGHRPSKYRTEPCTTFHTIGVCPYGERCNFYHNPNEKNEPPAVSKTSRYKTRLCKTWQKAGECPYGTKCDFAHGTDDLASNSPYKPRYKTRMCKVLQQTGRCPYGAQCTFAHKQSELRTDISLIYKYKTEICNAWAMGIECAHGSDCHFAHGEAELQRDTDKML